MSNYSKLTEPFRNRRRGLSANFYLVVLVSTVLLICLQAVHVFSREASTNREAVATPDTQATPTSTAPAQEAPSAAAKPDSPPAIDPSPAAPLPDAPLPDVNPAGREPAGETSRGDPRRIIRSDSLGQRVFLGAALNGRDFVARPDRRIFPARPASSRPWVARAAGQSFHTDRPAERVGPVFGCAADESDPSRAVAASQSEARNATRHLDRSDPDHFGGDESRSHLSALNAIPMNQAEDETFFTAIPEEEDEPAADPAPAVSEPQGSSTVEPLPAPSTPASSAAKPSLTLVNPRDSGGTIRYLVDGERHTLRPGESQSLRPGSSRILFHRGGEFGETELVLQDGTHEFRPTKNGWTLN